MNKFSFPKVEELPKPEIVLVKSLDSLLNKPAAIVLFDNITGHGLIRTKASFELSFDSRANHITLREFGEWVKAYYKEKAQ